MKVGFTGTQSGATTYQMSMLMDCIANWPITVLHHGDCIGADAQAHGNARGAGHAVWVVVHPPLTQTKRAFCRGDETCEMRGYLDRNHDIVDETEALIACPGEYVEQLRSGTWATIRYARKMGKPVTIIYPDGSHE